MMSKTNTVRKSSARNYFFALGLIVALFAGYQAWHFYSTPPSLGATPEAMKTLDGLFTAVTARDRAKLATCMERIEVHFAEGRLSEKALQEVRTCCKIANANEWEQAAKRLYWIIFEQPQ